MSTRIDRRYGLLTVAYLATIYWLSSLPDLGGREEDPLLNLVMNLGHAPLFGGLAFCVLKSLSGAWKAEWARYGLTFVATGACGVLDEWHQSFVPGRCSSAGDVLTDLVGIAAVLIVIRVYTVRKRRRPPAPAPVWCARQP